MKAVVAGATGLIGGFLVKELASDPAFSEVVALTRNERENNGKVRWQKIDFSSHSELGAVTDRADVVFCCLGTTMKKAGSKNAFLKVDYQYVVNLAEEARTNNVRQFSVVSAMGAKENSKIFYNHIKGWMEKDIRKLGFDELILFHPSILLGPRQEKRTGEKIGIAFAKFISPLLFGSMKKYHPIEAEAVAKAMNREAKHIEKRHQVLTYQEILKS